MISVVKIDDVIKLAQARENDYNIDSMQSNDLDLALESYVKNLSFDEVKSLQSIMYLGRDGDYDHKLTPEQIYKANFEYFDKEVGWNTKPIEINQMVGKGPLAEYLINGKKILGL